MQRRIHPKLDVLKTEKEGIPIQEFLDIQSFFGMYEVQEEEYQGRRLTTLVYP